MLLGIDIGTSSLKAMIINPNTKQSFVFAKDYDVVIPKIRYAEQNPETWWNALKEVLLMLQQKYTKAFEEIKAIGFSGQMHGLVMVNKKMQAVYNSIIWLDQRSEKQVDFINSKISYDKISKVIQNRPFTGFALPSLLWIRDNEKEIYNTTSKIMQPKDYIRMKLTGVIGCDVSDSSATAAFNIKQRTWAFDILEQLDLDCQKLPDCSESFVVAGEICANAAKETGLKKGIPVVFGCGDQQAQSIGNGAVTKGTVISNIGTGGQIAAYSPTDIYDSKLRTHTFCHAINKAYTIFGASLCSGLSMKWLKNNVLNIKTYDEMTALAKKANPGSSGLIYLPYLSGERTPHMNTDAKGIFFGMTLIHDKSHFARAVMEGVTFGLKDSLKILEQSGITANKIIASGGGAQSKVWLQTQADIFGKEVTVCKVKEQACLGACIIAGLGTGVFKNVNDAVNLLVEFEDTTYAPSSEFKDLYEEAYIKFGKIYEANKDLF